MPAQPAQAELSPECVLSRPLRSSPKLTTVKAAHAGKGTVAATPGVGGETCSARRIAMPAGVDVTGEGSKATLSGWVRSWAEVRASE